MHGNNAEATTLFVHRFEEEMSQHRYSLVVVTTAMSLLTLLFLLRYIQTHVKYYAMFAVAFLIAALSCVALLAAQDLHLHYAVSIHSATVKWILLATPSLMLANWGRAVGDAWGLHGRLIHRFGWAWVVLFTLSAVLDAAVAGMGISPQYADPSGQQMCAYISFAAFWTDVVGVVLLLGCCVRSLLRTHASRQKCLKAKQDQLVLLSMLFGCMFVTAICVSLGLVLPTLIFFALFFFIPLVSRSIMAGFDTSPLLSEEEKSTLPV